MDDAIIVDIIIIDRMEIVMIKILFILFFDDNINFLINRIIFWVILIKFMVRD